MTESDSTATAICINDWLAEQGGPIVKMFPHDHLELPEGHFSAYIEGWYHDGMYGMYAVSEAILNGELLLPPNVQHEMYSHCEMYFYTAN